MTKRIDEETAWDLVRKIRQCPGDRVTGRPIYHDSDPETWLQVHLSGEWNLSRTPSETASGVLDLFIPIQLQEDLVIGQIGQSLDGRIATATGQSHYITGPADICRLHRLRALVDAVLVGASTVASDNPSLTVREVEGTNPVRVVLDPSGRLSPQSKVFSDDAARTLHVRASAPGESESSDGNSLWLPTDGSGRFAPRVVIEALRGMSLRRVLVEGGANTVSAFLRAGVLDRLHVTVSPILIGGGRPALEMDPIDQLQDALRPRCRQFRLGEDILFDLDLR